MRAYDILVKKRDGKPLNKEEINFFVKGYTDGSIPDYQASAFLMATFINGMNHEEIVDLTESMIHSGSTINLDKIHGFKADKHSTGGVGDKTSLIIAPLVASFDVPMAKMSGRGLGHTGGTIDKLESIPGFTTEMSPEDFIDQVNDIKVSIIGQTSNVAPADKKFYALRDVTATVDHPALIASSIMSKKIASGADGIVLDVKMGSGAFLKTLDEAKHLAELMVSIGENLNRKTVALITNMDDVLGYAVGNSLEVIEAMETLQDKGPEDLKEISIELSANILVISGRFDTIEEAREACHLHLQNGKAFDKFKEWTKAQGATSFNFKEPSYKEEVLARQSGYLVDLNTQGIGETAGILGAGRKTKEDTIDPSAGLLMHIKQADEVKEGDIIATLYADDKNLFNEAKEHLYESLVFDTNKPTKTPLIFGRVFKDKDQVTFVKENQ